MCIRPLSDLVNAICLSLNNLIAACRSITTLVWGTSCQCCGHWERRRERGPQRPSPALSWEYCVTWISPSWCAFEQHTVSHTHTHTSPGTNASSQLRQKGKGNEFTNDLKKMLKIKHGIGNDLSVSYRKVSCSVDGNMELKDKINRAFISLTEQHWYCCVIIQ